MTDTTATRDEPACEDRLAHTLAERGWLVAPGFLDEAGVAALRAEVAAHRPDFRAATISRGRVHAPAVRSDHIHWIEDGAAGPATRAWLDRLERLRLAINRAAFLGLFDLEAHYAIYPPGAFYARHLDRFRDDSRRAVTAILYLNEAWQPEDGGELRLWLDDAGTADSITVLPEGGTLVLFLSDRYWHEVLPARRERLSLTGWFLTRA